MSNAPLYETLREFSDRNRISFHMPGHKNGVGLADFCGGNMFRADVTELDGLDNLKAPCGIIAQAEKLAAHAFGADNTHFLVNGSTVGILAMLYGTLRSGDRVLVDRGCHESVVNALKICRARAVFVSPEIDGEFGLPTGVSVEAVRKAFEKYSDIKAVILTSPNYFGRVCKLEEIAELTHDNNAVLLVDEAHGAHFAFGAGFPKTAMSAGADAAVQSMHKTLPCPNQTALLHVGGDRVSDAEIKEAINMFQTTSPSYLLMACMDYARSVMENSADKIKETVDIINKIKGESKLKIMKSCDPFRLVIDTQTLGRTGYSVMSELARKGIYAEGANPSSVIFILNQYNTEQEIRLLFSTLECMSGNSIEKLPGCMLGTLSEWDFGMEYNTELVPLGAAEGKICGANIVVYPPCVPVILTGEKIDVGKIEYLNRVNKDGGQIQGVENGCLRVLK